MAIKIKNAPKKSIDELNKSMDWFHNNRKSLSRAKSSSGGDGTENIPHKVYNMQRDDILDGKGLEVAKLVGWRYILQDDDQQFHVVEVGTDDSDNHNLTEFNEGDHVNNFVSTYNGLDNHSSVSKKDFEINVLRVPACHVLAIWLKGDGNDDEIIIPLAPSHQGFEAGKSYGLSEFTKALKSVALELSQFIDEDE
ncbi:MAG: hypothetical protein ACJASR_001869 [Psychroserpens sp.]|jgi:hypothetical protein